MKGGVGSQAMALRELGADFEHYKLVEFDKYPVASYNAIHHTNFEPTDITQVKGIDLQIVDVKSFTYLLTASLVRTYPLQVNNVVWKRAVEHVVVCCGRLRDF